VRTQSFEFQLGPSLLPIVSCKLSEFVAVDEPLLLVLAEFFAHSRRHFAVLGGLLLDESAVGFLLAVDLVYHGFYFCQLGLHVELGQFLVVFVSHVSAHFSDDGLALFEEVFEMVDFGLTLVHEVGFCEMV
jgi:hypothetical protein